MELERDIRIVVIAYLDDEQLIEPNKKKANEYQIRFDEKLKKIAELYSADDDEPTDYVDGFRMKCRFIKSSHLSSFTKEQDRIIEITEATRNQAHIDVVKNYPIDSFDLAILSVHLAHSSFTVNDWWKIYKQILPNSADFDVHQKQIQLFCAPAFRLPLPRQLARQSNCLIKFYEMFKTTLFSIYRRSSSSSFLSTIQHILPVVRLSFRPTILRWFDQRIENHPRLKRLRYFNQLCLVAKGSKKTSFQYDFSLMERAIMRLFDPSERLLYTFVKRFALKHLRCSLDNSFLRTSVLWICENHQLEQYHHQFEVWVAFMRDVCRKRFLSHYFLENLNVYEEHSGLEEILKTINYENIDQFMEKLEENLIFSYVYSFTDRLALLLNFLRTQPIFSLKMKTIYTVNVKSQFTQADCSLEEMCSVICHLSFLEDNDPERWRSFWHQQWKPLFIDFDRDDIVLQSLPFDDIRPDQMAQQMTESVWKLIQFDFSGIVDEIRTNINVFDENNFKEDNTGD